LCRPSSSSSSAPSSLWILIPPAAMSAHYVLGRLVAATTTRRRSGKPGTNALFCRSYKKSWAALHSIPALCFPLSSSGTGYASINQSL
jgi:hypothetical protein